MPTYSNWVILPDVTLIMASGDSARFHPDTDSQPADVYIRNGEGVVVPRGRYEWAGALGGPRPQDRSDAYHSGWKGTRNVDDGWRWYNTVDQAEFVDEPGAEFVWPSAHNPDVRGGGTFFYGYGFSSSSIAGNGWLESQWEGMSLTFTYGEVIDNAGALGTGPDPSHDPTDPVYAGLFPAGADYIEFESDNCTVLTLDAYPDESQFEPVDSYFNGQGRDPMGAVWCVSYLIPESNGLTGWLYYHPGAEPWKVRLSTDDVSISSFWGQGTVEPWGVIGDQSLSGPWDVGVDDPAWRPLDLNAIKSSPDGVFQFVVTPFYSQPGAYPPFSGGGAINGTFDSGSWYAYRPAPRFALRTTVKPVRIRARYPDGTDPPDTGTITGEIVELRARFTG